MEERELNMLQCGESSAKSRTVSTPANKSTNRSFMMRTTSAIPSTKSIDDLMSGLCDNLSSNQPISKALFTKPTLQSMVTTQPKNTSSPATVQYSSSKRACEWSNLDVSELGSAFNSSIDIKHTQPEALNDDDDDDFADFVSAPTVPPPQVTVGIAPSFPQQSNHFNVVSQPCLSTPSSNSNMLPQQPTSVSVSAATASIFPPAIAVNDQTVEDEDDFADFQAAPTTTSIDLQRPNETSSEFTESGDKYSAFRSDVEPDVTMATASANDSDVPANTVTYEAASNAIVKCITDVMTRSLSRFEEYSPTGNVIEQFCQSNSGYYHLKSLSYLHSIAVSNVDYLHQNKLSVDDGIAEALADTWKRLLNAVPQLVDISREEEQDRMENDATRDGSSFVCPVCHRCLPELDEATREKNASFYLDEDIVKLLTNVHLKCANVWVNLVDCDVMPPEHYKSSSSNTATTPTVTFAAGGVDINDLLS